MEEKVGRNSLEMHVGYAPTKPIARATIFETTSFLWSKANAAADGDGIFLITRKRMNFTTERIRFHAFSANLRSYATFKNFIEREEVKVLSGQRSGRHKWNTVVFCCEDRSTCWVWLGIALVDVSELQHSAETRIIKQGLLSALGRVASRTWHYWC